MSLNTDFTDSNYGTNTSLDNNKYNVLIIFLIVIMLIVIILLFAFRRRLFEYRSSMTTEEALELGFGYYDTPIISECLNNTGKCTETGITTSVQHCIPNPVTKYGCINNEGEQTFKSIIKDEPCNPICRSSIWSNEETSQCLYLSDNNTCIPQNVTGNKVITKTCISNDATGINTCTYVKTTNNTDTILPEGCTFDTTNNIVICKPGSIYTEIIPCNDPVSENGNILSRCGIWAYRHRTPITLEDISPPSVITTSTCTSSNGIVPSPHCLSFETGLPISGDLNLFEQGWFNVPMTCVSSLTNDIEDNDWTGWNINEPFNMSDGSICNSVDISTCTSDLKQIKDNLVNELPSNGCISIDNKIIPTCQRTCIYVNNVIGNWIPQIKNIIGRFKVIYKGNVNIINNNNNLDIESKISQINNSLLINNTHLYFLGLNNIPCSSSNTFLAPNQQSRAMPLMPQLSDCLGDPSSDLEQTPCLMIDAINISNNPITYNLPLSCQNKLLNIILHSSLLITFKPTRDLKINGINNFNGNTPYNNAYYSSYTTGTYTDNCSCIDNINSNPNILYCRIIALLGSNYVGLLSFDIITGLSWNQKNINTTVVNTNDIPGSEFIVTYNGNNTYNIRSVLYPDMPITIQSTTINPTVSDAYIPVNLDNINIGLDEPFNNNLISDKLDELNKLRGSRLNRETCNVMTTGKLPAGYSGV